MTRPSWIRNLFGRRPHTIRTRSAHRTRLSCETFEDRVVPATLVSDLSDYAPGSTAFLTAAGYGEGATVTFQVTSETPGPGQDPWSVTDGSAADLDGELNGVILTSWLVDPFGAYIDATLTATATGDAGTAGTTFTDSGDDAPPITGTAGWHKVEDGDEGFGERETTITCPTGEVITMISIKSGSDAFTYPANYHPEQDPAYANTGPKHSAVIFEDGTYDGYTVSGIGTATVTITAGTGIKDISHVDYFCEDDEDPTLANVTIEGRKFNDLNGDGDDEGGTDPGITGWPINVTLGGTEFTIYSGNNYFYDAITDTLTDEGDLADGAFRVDALVLQADLVEGISYSVEEEQDPEWTQTAGDGDPDEDGFQPFTGTFLPDEQEVSGLDFGNFENIDVSGYKWNDTDGDGEWDTGEEGIEGWTIYLNGGDDQTTTDSDGYYSFTNLGPGSYTVTEDTSDTGWTNTYDGSTTVDASSGEDAAGDFEETEVLNFGNFENIDISGYKWNDLDGDKVWDEGEPGIEDWTIYLEGPDGTVSTTTGSDGSYTFENLGPGSYTITEDTSDPLWFNTYDGSTTINATSGTNASGTEGVAEELNFGNQYRGLEQGDTATIGYWQNPNGQALIKKLNGSATCKALGNWLATTFPNLYGATAGAANNLYGKTNTQVAAYYVTLFNMKGQKTYAQTLGTALAVYATTSGLAGGNYAAAYGFTVTAAGTGAKLYNVGPYGAAIGLLNDTTHTVLDLLKQANTIKSDGYSTAEFNALNSIFTGINEMGDI